MSAIIKYFCLMGIVFIPLSLIACGNATTPAATAPTTVTGTNIPTSATVTTAQIMEKAKVAMQNVKNYHISETTTASLDQPSYSITTGTSTGSGTIDEANQAFGINTDTTTERNIVTSIGGTGVPTSTSSKESMKMYMLDNIVYLYKSTDVKPTWSSSASRQNDWKQISFVDVTKAIDLLDGATLKMAGQEVIGGTSCYILDVTTDIKKVFNMMMNQPGMVSDNAETIPYWDQMSRVASVKMWVAEDTFTLTRLDYSMGLIKYAPQSVGLPPGFVEFKSNWQISVKFSDYNRAGPVVVPDEAKSPAG